MEVSMCETCLKRPAKFKCEDCEVLVCPADVKRHKEDKPGFPHTMKPLKALAPLPVVLPSPIPVKLLDLPSDKSKSTSLSSSEVRPQPLPLDQTKSKPTETINYRSSGESLAPQVLVGKDSSSSKSGKAPLEAFAKQSSQIREESKKVSAERFEPIRQDSGQRNTVPAVSQSSLTAHSLELKPYTVFCSHLDAPQGYQLNKWMLHPSEAYDLLKSIEAAGPQVKVCGVYGPMEFALKLVGFVLSLPDESLRIPRDLKEGIIAYFRAETKTLCFYYKIGNEKTYPAKPYRQSSREAVYLRLLFDLCPAVVCCISKEIQQDWYWTRDKLRSHPFLPKAHQSMNVTVTTKVVQSSESQPVEVVLPSSYHVRGRLMLTNDQWPYVFQVEHIKQNYTEPLNKAISALADWLNARISSVSDETWNDYFTLYDEYRLGSFPIFTNAINKLSSEAADTIRAVKIKYEQAKSAVEKEAENCFNAFYDKFTSTFICISEYNEFWPFKEKFTDFHNELREQFVQKHQYHMLKTHYKKATKFVVGINGSGKKLSKRNLSAAVTTFFEEENTVFLHHIRDFLVESVQKLQVELTQLIKDLVPPNREQYLITTFYIEASKDSVRVQDLAKANRLLLSAQSEMHLHVLDPEVAFATAVISKQTVKFNPTGRFLTYDVNLLPDVQSELLIASGSTVVLFVAFSNEKRRARYGRALELKEMYQGKWLEVYGEEVHLVRSACVQQKARRIFLINENGNLFIIDLKCESRLTPVKKNRKGKSSSDRDEEQISGSNLVPLTPARGKEFYNIKSSDDETLYFLQSDSAIEVYDLNYMLSRVIEVPSPDVCFKVLSNDPYKFVITLHQNELKAYRLQKEVEYIDKTVGQSKEEEAVPGNPIIDMAFHAFFKFGCTNPEGGDNSLFYLCTEVPNPQCLKYVQSISLLSQALDLRGTLPASLENPVIDSLPADEISVSIEDLRWRVLSRAPVHICSIQGGDLIPLQNGLNHFGDFFGKRRKDFISDLESYIKFGALESIIENTQELKVVAIIGRQCSRKGYLLNRLFGTRFDVVPHRRTDGIWLSAARIENQVFLVMNCEGLFSVDMSEQEEKKMCLLLASIADMTILNQDLTFNRHFSSLIEKFRFGMGILKGSSLFKGRLEIAIRNVPDHQDQGTYIEFQKFVDNLIENRKTEFLRNQFSGKLICSLYHDFEIGDMFEAVVNTRRKCYLEETPVRWTSGRDFLRNIKSVMAHILTDDFTNMDFRSFQLKLDSIFSDFECAIEFPPAFEQLISPEKPEVFVSLKLFGASFKLSLFDVKVDLTRKYQVFEEFMRRYVDDEKRKYNHNHWYQSLDEFMAAYFKVYWTVLLARFEAKVANSNTDFRTIFLREASDIERIFEKLVRSKHNLCRKKCQQCDLVCIKCQNHKDHCDCSTSHKCPFNCSICPDVKCSQIAGHTCDVHSCMSKPPCISASPGPSVKVFCDGRVFQSGSMAYKDPQLSQCTHKSSSEIDIVFILDCTGSMELTFPQVKTVITQITSQYEGSQLSCKFAIVEYTDHQPNNGAFFPGDYPVDVYPKNRQLASFESSEAQAYLTALTADGGGKNGGEAMLDGMNMCNSLLWRPKASRLVFIIADEGPHGREFSSDSKYPDGCPCGYNWRTQLFMMKQEKTEIRLVQLHTRMNATADLFQQEYGPRFKVIELRDMNLISQKVAKSIVNVIEHILKFVLAS